jgi:hypothetical protein
MLGGKKKSKRERIAEMLEQGFDVAYISRKLKTSPQNIYKEKSLKKLRNLNEDAITPVTTFIDDKIRSRKPHAKITRQPKHIEEDSSPNQINLAFRRPTKKEHIQLYSGFLEGKGPEQIIAVHGIDAEIAESEYKRFLKLRGTDPKALQLSIASISNTDSEEVVALIKKLNRGNLLSNDEVMSLIKLLIRSAESNYFVKLLSDPEIVPSGPGFVIRPSCSQCERQLSGTLVDLASDDGKQVFEELHNVICPVCLKPTD